MEFSLLYSVYNFLEYAKARCIDINIPLNMRLVLYNSLLFTGVNNNHYGFPDPCFVTYGAHITLCHAHDSYHCLSKRVKFRKSSIFLKVLSLHQESLEYKTLRFVRLDRYSFVCK